MIKFLETPMQTYEHEDNVPQELQDQLKKAEYKSREIKFAYKLLLVVAIPWIWLCIMSYYMIAFIDQYDYAKAEKKRQAVAEKVRKDMVKLDQQGNRYATLYLVEHGSFEQRSTAFNALKDIQDKDAQYFNLVYSSKYSDVPGYNILEDHEYIRNLMKYVSSGYFKAVNELVDLETKLRDKKKPTAKEIESLKLIEQFKQSLI
ncbi:MULTISPECIES: hypothetical protein [Acinetobacter]|uniref:Uncharacterized protein n=1 Tax=Acinetobacter indicus TaxID=756892 RepID=A0A6C0Y7P7_9GAMM|nr:MULTISPECIES: hypothetical protein [Acinetobacter]QIC71892.1 hypothetical protein FSC09_16000 [Acinetobacter indicus]QKQ71428.1 hypothetical protein E5Y90_14450 [Acinetobacter sp. 10FS3-1]